MRVARNKPPGYRAPSCSWAAVNGGFRWLFSDKNASGNYQAKFLDYSIEPRGSDAFGELIGAYVVLKGLLWKIPEALKAITLNVANTLAECDSQPKGMMAKHWRDWLLLDTHKEGISLGDAMGQEIGEITDLFLFKIRDDVSLLLASNKGEEFEGPDTNLRCYERIGIHGPNRRTAKCRHWTHQITPQYETAICKLI